MRQFYLFFTFSLLAFSVSAQDYLISTHSNPSLFPKGHRLSNEKLLVNQANFFYRYDTLSLPFIDDFSKNHFPERITDTADSRLTDTLIYSVLVNEQVYRDTFGFTSDSTFRYELGPAGDTISRVPNILGTVKMADLTVSPISYSTLNVFPAYNYFDRFGFEDSIAVEADFKQDSALFYIVPPNPNDFYTDRSAYLNTTFGLNPPSIGVVTFDGLNEFGFAYDFDDPSINIQSDRLSSVPINLSGLPDTNVYFSFFYQPRGLSLDRPEQNDSLVVEFFQASTQKWGNIWSTTGGEESDTFKQVILHVPTKFHENGFRFRFKSYSSPTGAFDQWHIDYLYLNNGRSPGDTVYKDIAYIYDAPSLLADYHAMPWFHFTNNPGNYMADSVRSFVTNNFDQSIDAINQLVIPDTSTNTIFYRFPVSVGAFVPIPPKFTVNFRYPLSGFEFPMDKVDSLGTFTSPINVDIDQGPSDPEDFILSNDTVFCKTILRDYYAYDDGTAEAGYGVNPDQGVDGFVAFMAVEFNIPFRDTLKGLQLYFLPQRVDISNQKFTLVIWNSLNPESVIYEKPISNDPVYSDDNGYVTYGLDSAVVVNQTFYIGLRAVGRNSLNIGYDLNTNNRSKIFWRQGNSNVWSNPGPGIQDGSLMLRPIFRNRVFGVGLDEIFGNKEKSPLKVYPNPAKNELHVAFHQAVKAERIEVMDISGRIILSNVITSVQSTNNFSESYQTAQEVNLDVSNLKNGLYIVRLLGDSGEVYSKKFLVNQ